MTSISAGGFFGVALTAARKLLAWGNNDFGELGNGDLQIRVRPVRVKLGAGVTVTAISGGSVHSLACTSNGGVLAWGGDTEGQLGNNMTQNSPVPVTPLLPAGIAIGIGSTADASYAIMP